MARRKMNALLDMKTVRTVVVALVIAVVVAMGGVAANQGESDATVASCGSGDGGVFNFGDRCYYGS